MGVDIPAEAVRKEVKILGKKLEEKRKKQITLPLQNQVEVEVM